MDFLYWDGVGDAEREKGGSGGSYEEFSQCGWMEWEWLPSFSSATCSELQEGLLGEGQEKKRTCLVSSSFFWISSIPYYQCMLTCPVSPAPPASRRAPASTFFFVLSHYRHFLPVKPLKKKNYHFPSFQIIGLRKIIGNAGKALTHRVDPFPPQTQTHIYATDAVSFSGPFFWHDANSCYASAERKELK